MSFRRILVSCLLAAIVSQSGAAFAASDTSPGVKAKRHRISAQKPAYAVRARPPDSCAQFGAGFVRMAGSDTCIQIGGAVDVGFGVGVGR
ncbi:hypothetical protein [Bradyrhizobium sp. G127]|jgi:hypothetical protein|uniref:hypothetical protein n=1 Tax=Bradyrhizobium sp. G127 TaxID=2904800 RepID=UPI001F3367A3|nr:hypothetical protein [Bradyrhizobium sp. G127]MCF2523025.1 hypothetical protein [Bradyrhizobium sp. G127]